MNTGLRTEIAGLQACIDALDKDASDYQKKLDELNAAIASDRTNCELDTTSSKRETRSTPTTARERPPCRPRLVEDRIDVSTTPSDIQRRHRPSDTTATRRQLQAKFRGTT